MDIILLGITVVSLVVALVMSVAAWRVTRDEKKRSAARVAALSVAASATETADEMPLQIAADTKAVRESAVVGAQIGTCGTPIAPACSSPSPAVEPRCTGASSHTPPVFSAPL